MTDRELLEAAAKAAGYIVQEHVACDTWAYGAWVYEAGSAVDKDGEPKLFLWRPRDDDGDALRLAVKLRITPHIDASMTEAEWAVSKVGRGGFQSELHLDDPYAATRRAIVRAAAEIGREA
jgi:hypothetical protein